MPGFNLQTYRDQINYVLTGAATKASSAFTSDGALFQALNLAFIEIEQRFAAQMAERKRYNLVAGTESYEIGEIAGQRVDRLCIRNAAGDVLSLEFRGFDEFTALHDLDDATETGTPADWTFDPEEPYKILIRPIPDASVTNGLIAYAPYSSTQTSRIYNPGAGNTVTVTNGGTTVTLASELDAGYIVAGDEFGVCPTANTDGTALTSQSPFVWYRITALVAGATKAVGSFTLERAYEGPSGSSLAFVTAQVWQGERRYPKRFLWIPAYLALAHRYEFEDRESSDRYRGMAYAMLDRIALDSPGPNASRIRVGEVAPWK